MRCPYCGGNNVDRAEYCKYCGRDLVPQASNQPASRSQPSYQQQRPAPPPAGRPGNVPQPPYPPAGQVPPAQGRRAPVAPPHNVPNTRQPVAPTPYAPPVPPPPPEPPVPFPPRTIAQLQALEPGALPYNVVDSAIGDGKKKIVRIAYARGVAWQQVATLLKAFKEQQEEKFDTIIIQGVLERDTSTYSFTNGQFRFDRNVRLGGSITNRYQIETGNGFESDSIRIVLNE